MGWGGGEYKYRVGVGGIKSGLGLGVGAGYKIFARGGGGISFTGIFLSFLIGGGIDSFLRFKGPKHRPEMLNR